MNKNWIAPKKHKTKKWEEPKVIAEDPSKISDYKKFMEGTEGRENKGGDSRADIATRSSVTEKEFRRQQEAMRRLKERGWRAEDE